MNSESRVTRRRRVRKQNRRSANPGNSADPTSKPDFSSSAAPALKTAQNRPTLGRPTTALPTVEECAEGETTKNNCPTETKPVTKPFNNKTIKPPAVRSLVSMCATIASDRADLVSVDRLISLLDKTVAGMMPKMILPEMKWMLLGMYKRIL